MTKTAPGLAALATAMAAASTASAAVGGGWTNAGLTGQYYANTALTAPSSFTRKEVRLDFGSTNSLKPGGSISPSFQAVGPTNWSAEWTGQFIPRFSEAYTFKVFADDACVVKVRPTGGSSWTTVINQASYTGADSIGTYGPLTAGASYDIDITFTQLSGNWGLRVRWTSQSVPEEVIDTLTQSGYDNPDGTQAFRDLVKGARNSWNGINGNPAPAMDANGWPMGDGNYTFQESLNQGLDIDPLMQGTVAFSFNGSATVSVTGNCKSVTSSYNSGTNTTTGTFTVFANHWNASYFTFSNSHRDGTPTGPGGITNLKLMRPTAPNATTSYSATDPTPFTPQMEAAMAHFNAVRFQYVANQQKVWTDRTPPTYFNQAGGTVSAPQYGVGGNSSNGWSWEYKIMLCNESGRDLMISIPTVAAGSSPSDTTSYIYYLANLFKYGSNGSTPYTQATANPVYPPLNPNLHVYLELENELWNFAGVFGTDYNNIDALVRADAAANNADWAIINYDNSSTLQSNGTVTNANTLHYRKIITRLVEISNIFRSIFGNAAMPSGSIDPQVRPLYEWQYANSNNTASLGLTFADIFFNNADGQQHSSVPHPVNYYFWGGGGASYYGAVNGEGLTTLLPDQDFATPTVPTGYTVNPTGGSWTFTGTAGIAQPSSGSDIPPAYAGTQVGYVTDTGSMKVSVTFPSSQTSSLYAVSFKAVNRLQNGASAADKQNIRVFLDGQTDITAKTYSQGNGYTPPAYNTGQPWKAQNVAWTWSNYYYTQSFNITPGSTHTITIQGEGKSGATNQTVFLGEVQVTSVDAIFAGGIPGGGEATGQPVGSSIVGTMTNEASWAMAYGLQEFAYESGWSLGGDDGGSWIQLDAKYGDSRTLTAQKTFMTYFYQAGCAVDMFGTYAQWPNWSDYYDQDGILDIGTFPIIQGIDAMANTLAPEPTNGSAIPGALGVASATLANAGSISGGAINGTNGWISWNVIAPISNHYNFATDATPGASLSIDVDGLSIGTVANSANAAIAAPSGAYLTKGFHVVKVRSTNGSFHLTQLIVGAGLPPAAGNAVEVFALVNQPANSTSAAPSAVQSGLTASNVTFGAGLQGTNYGGLPKMTGCLQAGIVSSAATSLADAKTKNSYFTFSLTPTSGNTLALGSFLYHLSTDDGSHLVSSVGWSTDGTTFADIATTDVAEASNSIHDASANFGSVAALQGTAATVTLRIYVWGIGRYNTIGFGDTNYNAAVLNGSVSVVDAQAAGDLTGTALPLVGANIGSSSSGGATVRQSGNWWVTGAGAGVTGTADNIHMEGRTAAGNFQMLCRVQSITGGAPTPRGGLMLRETSAAGSRFVMVAASANAGGPYVYGSRTTTNGTGTETTASGSGSSYSFPNAWLMLQRIGDVVTIATSSDDANWTQIGTVTLSSLTFSLDVGVYCSNGNPSVTSQAVISNFSIIPLQSVYEAESLAVAAFTGPDYRTVTDPNYSNGAAIILDSTAVGNTITFVVPSLLAGPYDVHVGYKALNTRGTVQLAVGRADNFAGTHANVGPVVDQYAANQAFLDVDLGTWTPGSTSDKWFQFTVTGKNASSTGYTEVIDYIKLIPQ